jgi:hypothetical protein
MGLQTRLSTLEQLQVVALVFATPLMMGEVQLTQVFSRMMAVESVQ